jgi:hypothetical protein
MADYDTFHEEATRVIGEEEPDLPDEEVERRADELWRADQQASRAASRAASRPRSSRSGKPSPIRRLVQRSQARREEDLRCITPATLEELHDALDRVRLPVAFTLTYGKGGRAHRIVVKDGGGNGSHHDGTSTLSVSQAREELEDAMDDARDGDDVRLELTPMTVVRVPGLRPGLRRPGQGGTEDRPRTVRRAPQEGAG